MRATLIGMGTLVAPGIAWACICDAGVSAVRPVRDAVDVPLNARVVWVGRPDGRVEVVETEGGARLEGQVQPLFEGHRVYGGPWYGFVPAEPLRPNTRYTIRRLDAWPAIEPEDAWVFTTGAEPDDVAPVFAGIERWSAWGAPAGDGCYDSCWEAGDVILKAAVGLAEVEGAVFVDVEWSADGVEWTSMSRDLARKTEFSVDSYNCAPTAELVPGTEYCVRATAYDLAGNATVGTMQPCAVVTPCGRVEPACYGECIADADVGADVARGAPDGDVADVSQSDGGPADASLDTERERGGCAVSGDGFPPFWLLLLAAAWRRTTPKDAPRG